MPVPVAETFFDAMRAGSTKSFVVLSPLSGLIVGTLTVSLFPETPNCTVENLHAITSSGTITCKVAALIDDVA